VSLGCEKLQPVRLLPSSTLPILASAPTSALADEQHQSFGDMVAAIMELAEKRLVQLNARRRVTRPASDLVVGLQCGGSDGVFRCHGESRGRLRLGPAGSSRRDGDVL